MGGSLHLIPKDGFTYIQERDCESSKTNKQTLTSRRIDVLRRFPFPTLTLGLICLRSPQAAMCVCVCVPVCRKRNTKEEMCRVLLKPPLARFPLCTLRVALPGASLTFTVVSEANFERIKGNWATQGLVPIVAPCQDCPYLHILSFFFLINCK